MKWLASILLLFACTPPNTTTGDTPREGCEGAVTCSALVERTCGAQNQCADGGSCTAARDLQSSDDQATCKSAWCDLGDSYKSCE